MFKKSKTRYWNFLCVCILLEHQFNTKNLSILSSYIGLFYFKSSSRELLQKSTLWSSALESHIWINLITSNFLFKEEWNTILFFKSCKLVNTWIWLVPHSHKSFVIIKTKMVIVLLGRCKKVHHLRLTTYRHLQ